MKHIITVTDKEITGSDRLSTAEPRIAVNAVLFDADHNIAILYVGKYDFHTLPGGGVEPGESFHTAVKREIWEETGCRCEIIGELGQIIENRFENDFTQERYYYVAQVNGSKGELHLTDEEMARNTTVVWFSIEQALKLISEKEHDNYQRKFIQKRDITALTEALIWLYTHDIPEYDTFLKIEPINKGLSSDKKYSIETTDGILLLLRVSDIAEYERRKAEYEMMAQVFELGVLTAQPYGFGLCNSSKNVYSLCEWIDGENAETSLSLRSEAERYELGLKSGEILQKIHSIPAPNDIEDWDIRFNRKTQHWIDQYKAKPEVHSDTGEMVIRYLEEHRNVLFERTQTFIHGDYNAENIIVMPNSEVRVIDFNNYNTAYGDPWWDMDNMAWMPVMYPSFYTGQINGHFNGEPPDAFWNVLTYYLAYDALAALTDPFGLNGIEDGTEIVNNILKWTDNFQNPVPTWYITTHKVEK